MHLIKILALITVTAAALGTAFADDPALQERLSLQHAQNASGQGRTTAAVYAGRRGIGHCLSSQNQRAETRFQLRATPHGTGYGAYVRE